MAPHGTAGFKLRESGEAAERGLHCVGGMTFWRCAAVFVLGLGSGCSGASSSALVSDGGSGAETTTEAGADGSTSDSGADGGASLAVTCTTPGNVGDTGHGCDFVLSPNALYPSGPSNDDLPPVTAPTTDAPHGDADPCTRKDPSSDDLYMTYTYTAGGFLSTEMAYSTDHGASWTDSASTPLWTGQGGGTTPDPYTGPGATGGTASGVINSETSNLAFRTVAGGVVGS